MASLKLLVVILAALTNGNVADTTSGNYNRLVEFIGGSLGSVMGEKFARAVDHCIAHRSPYLGVYTSK